MNCGMLLAAVGAMLVIDRGGRRILLLVGQFTMMAALVLLVVMSVLGIAAAAAVGTVIFTTAFGFSVGPVPWLIFAELFDPTAVGAASSVCVPVNWTTNIIVSVTFPALDAALNYYAFLPFAVFNLLLLMFTYSIVPETRGRTPADMANLIDERLHGKTASASTAA